MTGTCNGTVATFAALKVGDVVCLRSGGPNMTILAMNGDHLCRCGWFEAENCKAELRTIDGIPLVALTYPPDDPEPPDGYGDDEGEP